MEIVLAYATAAWPNIYFHQLHVRVCRHHYPPDGDYPFCETSLALDHFELGSTAPQQIVLHLQVVELIKNDNHLYRLLHDL